MSTMSLHCKRWIFAPGAQIPWNGLQSVSSLRTD